MLGQLFFGWLGDKMGRKKIYGATLMLMVFSSVGSALSFSSDPKSIMITLCFFRFWLGFGVGGDYPLSAVIMSEYANTSTRGGFIAAVFAMQGIGILAGATVSIIVSAAFNNAYPRPSFSKSPLESTPHQAHYVWRIIFIFGAIPALLTYYWRMKMPETARYTALVEGNAKQAAIDMTKVLSMELQPEQEKVDKIRSDNYGLFSRQFLRRHGLHLVGTTSTWFLLDVAFHSQNLFQKDVFSAIGWLPKAESMNAVEEVSKISRAQALVALCSTMPGYWFTVATIDCLGRFFIQLMGFTMMTIFMFALAIPYYTWRDGQHKIVFLTLYAFTFFFANFGPNSTTFAVPAEIFPTRMRSTCHGISAAAGRLGTIVGAFGFLYAAQSSTEGSQDPGYPTGLGVRTTLLLLGVINGLGILFTFLIPETKGKSLEDLSGENLEMAATPTISIGTRVTRSQNRLVSSETSSKTMNQTRLLCKVVSEGPYSISVRKPQNRLVSEEGAFSFSVSKSLNKVIAHDQIHRTTQGKVDSEVSSPSRTPPLEEEEERQYIPAHELSFRTAL